MTMLEDLREVVRINAEASEEDVLLSENGEYEAANLALEFVIKHAEQIERDARDAEIGRYFIEHAEWIRDEDDTLMAIRMLGKPDLSCRAFRRDAITVAMHKEGE